MPLPIVALDRVAHIGTLDPADRGSVFSYSYEGHGLSVSVDPEEWEAIARLGGLPWHLLSKPGGTFVDYWSLGARRRRQIAGWGVHRGYVVRRAVWAAEWWDDELETSLTSLHVTRREALGEVDDIEGAVKRTVTLEATARLRRRLGMDVGLDVFDYVLECYVEDAHPEVDGIWWADAYGPLSAPRGVILPGHVSAWTAAPLPRSEAAGLLGVSDSMDDV